MASGGTDGPLPEIYALSPPHGAITDTDHGGYVVITTWIMMCFFVVCVSVRLATRYSFVLAGGIDDVIAGVAMLTGVAQSAVIHRSATNGLGQHQDSLSAASYAIYAKNYYYGNILFVVTLLFSKISTLILVMRLAAQNKTRRICFVIGGIFTAWAVGSVISLAFQCDLPRPWDYRVTSNHQCPVNLAAVNYSIAVGDIITDLVCVTLPAFILWNVRIAARRRWTLIGAFGCRLAVCICSAFRLASLVTYFRSSDRSWEAVTPQTWTQIVQCLSIMTACIPSLKVFLGSFESGFMDISLKMHGGATYRTGYSHNSSKQDTNGSHGQRSNRENGSYAMTSLTGKGDTTQADLEADPTKLSADGSDERGGSVSESTTRLRRRSLSDELSRNDDFIMVTREVDVRGSEGYDVDKYSHSKGGPHYPH